MHLIDPNSKPESAEPIARLWRSILQRIATVFGRLEYLAGLRDAATGLYSHPALDNVAGPEDMDRILRQSHRRVFSEWLAFSLEEQKSDLEDFLNERGGARGMPDYRSLVPPEALDVERRLYLTDLVTVLELLNRETGGGSRTPEA